jgi:hypothetical protein
MAKCWRFGGGKTITLTTTGNPRASLSDLRRLRELPSAQDERKKGSVLQHAEVETLATAKPPADDASRTGSKMA